MRKDKLWLATMTGEHEISIEIAETPEEKALGLMFRTGLGEKQGMLFPYPQPQELTMWMRNTYIPLDMIFIRADGVVHRVERRTQPMSERIIASNGPVVAVLELEAGAADRLRVEAGTLVRHPLFGAASRP